MNIDIGTLLIQNKGTKNYSLEPTSMTSRISNGALHRTVYMQSTVRSRAVTFPVSFQRYIVVVVTISASVVPSTITNPHLALLSRNGSRNARTIQRRPTGYLQTQRNAPNVTPRLRRMVVATI